ncbi:hypothetical protein TanjilG_23656 [Lupinus angustifolius]|uniref:Uncharacterized protein n=1 Tax=Lupinus angustifolius TaxID=3871 RepID=A0A4P1RAB3_LUPAN|nr:hypothetical protein TanjilG_23656 [Lupinus angustifolius]
MKVPNLSNRSIGSSNSNKQNICCFHCAGPLSKQMIGSGVGGTTSAFYGFNQGGVVPALAQLVSSSYHAAMSSPPSEDDEIQKSRTSSTI